MSKIKQLAQSSLMEKITSSTHPLDAISCLSGLAHYVNHCTASENQGTPLGRKEAEGLGYIMAIIRTGLDEVYETLSS